MKEYSTFPRAPELEPYNEMHFNVKPSIPLFWVGSYFSVEDCSQQIIGTADWVEKKKGFQKIK